MAHRNPNRRGRSPRYHHRMAGPIAIAVLRTLRPMVCPHCGTRQLRAPVPRVSYRICTACRRRFDDRGKR